MFNRRGRARREQTVHTIARRAPAAVKLVFRYLGQVAENKVKHAKLRAN
jgi:hypothetical protein